MSRIRWMPPVVSVGLIAATLVVPPTALAAGTAPPPPASTRMADQVPSVAASVLADPDAGYVVVAEDGNGSLRVEHLPGSSLSALLRDVTNLSSADSVLSWAPDERVGVLEVAGTATGGDPLRIQQWALDRVAFESSWPIADGAGAVVAVIDTGVDATHEDLLAAVLPGWDAIHNLPGGISDPNGHGTHVAGTIASRAHNGRGGAGAAPGVRILPVRVLDEDGSGWLSNVVEGIVWAVDHGADVINLSLGGTGGGSVYRSAIRYATERGVVVVAAGGNEALSGNPVVYPAADPESIAVAAASPTGERAAFSSYGSWIDLAAPGTGILAPCPAAAAICPAGGSLPPGYARLSGTSMAAPHVAATAALLQGAHPHLTPAEVRSLLQGTADDLGTPGWDPELGSGLVDPLAALARADGAPAAPTALTARPTGARAVEVAWSAPARFDLAGFRVYRDGALTATVADTARSFTDTPRAAGAEHSYQVRAVDLTGLEGLPAGPVTVRIPPPPPRPAPGYWVIERHGRVATGGSAPFLGDVSRRHLAAPIVAAASARSGRGYWLAGADGAVFSFGDAAFHGSMAGARLNSPIVGMAATPSGRGYWLLGGDGGVFTFGDAAFYGSTGNLRLNQPVVDMAATPSGRGYWLVASDGGIFAFGDAPFHGSTGNLQLNQPVTSLTASADGVYWLVAADGGIFAFGAPFHGSLPGLADPLAAAGGRRIRATAGGAGYYILGAKGHVFAFGAALPHTSAAGPDAVDLLVAP